MDKKIRPRGLARNDQRWVDLVRSASASPSQIPIRAITHNAASETFYPMALVGLGHALESYLNRYGYDSYRELLKMLPAKEIAEAVERFYLPNLEVFRDVPSYAMLRENMNLLRSERILQPIREEVERTEGIQVNHRDGTWVVTDNPTAGPLKGEVASRPSAWHQAYRLFAPGYERLESGSGRLESRGPFPLASLRPDLRRVLVDEPDPLYQQAMGELTPFLKDIALFWTQARQAVRALGVSHVPSEEAATERILQGLAERYLKNTPLGVSAAQFARALRGFNG